MIAKRDRQMARDLPSLTAKAFLPETPMPSLTMAMAAIRQPHIATPMQVVFEHADATFGYMSCPPFEVSGTREDIKAVLCRRVDEIFDTIELDDKNHQEHLEKEPT